MSTEGTAQGSKDRVTIRQLPTGVPGLDEILGGGLPEFSFNILAGAPGCGKTTLAHQMMFANATPERPALYFTCWASRPSRCCATSSSTRSSRMPS
jgi:circadian clock protein KaiC